MLLDWSRVVSGSHYGLTVWKQHRESRSMPVAIHEYQPPVCLDRTMHHRKAKSRASLLGSGERLEQTVSHFRWNAGSLVGHPHSRRPAFELNPEGNRLRQVLRRERRNLQLHTSTIGAGLYRVEREVEDRAVKEVFVSFDDDRTGRSGTMHVETRSAIRMGRSQLGCPPCNLADVHGVHAGNPNPRKIQELAEQTRQ